MRNPGRKNMSILLEPSLFDISVPGRRGVKPPAGNVPAQPIEELLPQGLLSEEAPELPELSELDCVRHYTHLSTMNYSVDANFYPLGSCTMKYNPKINEDMSRNPQLSGAHPMVDASLSQGMLRMMYELEQYMCEMCGLDAFTLSPAAGAQGELTGVLITAAYHRSNGETRHRIIVPDSAHGTNPASASLVGYSVQTCPSNAEGGMDLDELEKMLDTDVACVMLTNPNTFGIFDHNVKRIADMVHKVGAVFYGDGANLNAIVGRCRPGDVGFDIIHSNLHKTFSTPHGGGGPGSGPVGVKKHLIPFLPVPLVVKDGDDYRLETDYPQTIGRMVTFQGQIGVLVRAYSYMRMLGKDGLHKISDYSVLNANYMKARLVEHYACPFPENTFHEFVLSTKQWMDDHLGASAIGKRLLDFNCYAPTVHFPIPECLMIEPTETESKQTIDMFIDALIQIRGEIDNDPDQLHNAPQTTPIGKLDEVQAARKPIICYPCG
jgi:glycine cleavage system P protein (glycine dehydrogenase) subunit 2